MLLSSLFGFSIDCVFLVFAPNILWLFVGRTIAGITGASYSVASACVADISTDDNRTKNFGVVNAAFGLGFIIGPIIGGTLGQFGTHTPFIVCLLYTSDAADERSSVDLGGRRIIKKKKREDDAGVGIEMKNYK